MSRVHSMIGLLSWCTLVACSPAANIDQRGGQTFSLEQVAVHRNKPWSAFHDMRRTYQKYGLPVPSYVEEDIRNFEADLGTPGQTSVPVKPVKGDTEYLISVKVGNHNLTLDPDTGSADLWVFSTLQPQNQRGSRPVNRVYDAQGQGKQLSGHTWRISYGDSSSAKGQVFLDKVSIGDLTVEKQAVEAASTVSGTFIRDSNMDGLLGLAFSKLNTVLPSRQLTWFDNIKPQLKAPVFTCSLKRRKPGTYDFGYIDKAKYKGEIIWTDVKGQRGFWNFVSTGIIVNGVQTAITIQAVADTGSSLWYLPTAAAAAYYSNVKGAKPPRGLGGTVFGMWTFPCSAELPDITVLIAGQKLVIPGINMNYQEMSQGNCVGGIQATDASMASVGSIFGDVFLKNMYVIHEHPTGGQARLGFAQSPEDPGKNGKTA